MDNIEKNKNKILLIFLYLQPVIDVLTSFSINILEFNISFGVIVRLSFLIFLLAYFLTTKQKNGKKKSMFVLLIILIYLLLFINNILNYKDITVFMYEMQNTFRTFYFPIILILVNELFDKKIDCKHIKNILLIYVFFLLMPVLTNTSLDAYTQGKVGEVGWFNSANEISAIFSILLPFLFSYIVKIKEKYLKIIYTLLMLFALFVLGTKMTIISLVLTLLVFGVKYINLKIKSNKPEQTKIVFTMLIPVIFSLIILVPKTNFYKNINIHLNYLEINNISDLFAKGNFDHFIFSSRLKFLSNTADNYKESSFLEKTFGIGYIEKYGTDEVNLKLIEMDFFDILFRHGIVGFIIYISIFVYFTLEILKNNKTIYRLSVFLILFTSTLVGHVVTSPAVSIYVIIVLTNNIEESYEK